MTPHLRVTSPEIHRTICIDVVLNLFADCISYIKIGIINEAGITTCQPGKANLGNPSHFTEYNMQILFQTSHSVQTTLCEFMNQQDGSTGRI